MEEYIYIVSKSKIGDICKRESCTIDEGIRAIGSIVFSKISIPNETLSIENRLLNINLVNSQMKISELIEICEAACYNYCRGERKCLKYLLSTPLR